MSAEDRNDRYCGSSEVTRINELIALIALIVVNSTGKACIDYTDELVEWLLREREDVPLYR